MVTRVLLPAKFGGFISQLSVERRSLELVAGRATVRRRDEEAPSERDPRDGVSPERRERPKFLETSYLFSGSLAPPCLRRNLQKTYPLGDL